jgi:hypothetical protein
MRKVLTMLTAVTVACALFAAGSRPVHAQKDYMDAMKKKYEPVAKLIEEQKCNTCHGKSSKKQRSEFAKALEKALGEKKVKDAEKINKAFDAVADQEYADGKKYGDLLKSGALPAPFSE